ncbi:DUF2254 family protein [Gordonia sp. SID5947]|uniref:DUF2254 family protein n=1 Tax=Gordonia sp. SID5947 TaxID=2690315 RepID=UPI002351BE4E|nr:DUF2254 family protein [Gordonia sp. SID5947]
MAEIATRGRTLLAVDVARLERHAIDWDVRIEVLVSVGDHVPQGVPVVEARGDIADVDPARVRACLLFGDANQPSVSPAAALQAISDIALKAMSSGGNDPTVVVQALDHTEELLLMLAPRVRAAEASAPSAVVTGVRRRWPDYLAVGTDEIRRHSVGQAQVQRRLRALFATLLTACAPSQRAPIQERLVMLDAQARRDWADDLDRELASAADRQGYGSEWGRLHAPAHFHRPATPGELPEDGR